LVVAASNVRNVKLRMRAERLIMVGVPFKKGFAEKKEIFVV